MIACARLLCILHRRYCCQIKKVSLPPERCWVAHAAGALLDRPLLPACLRVHPGIVDVADCTNAALHLAGEGHVDRKRLCIFGQSAGGFSTLACLALK